METELSMVKHRVVNFLRCIREEGRTHTVSCCNSAWLHPYSAHSSEISWLLIEKWLSFSRLCSSLSLDFRRFFSFVCSSSRSTGVVFADMASTLHGNDKVHASRFDTKTYEIKHFSASISSSFAACPVFFFIFLSLTTLLKTISSTFLCSLLFTFLTLQFYRLAAVFVCSKWHNLLEQTRILNINFKSCEKYTFSK